MRIAKKCVRNLASNLQNVQPGQSIFIAILDPAQHGQALAAAGFSDDMEIGETILPAPVGPTSTFNAEGKEILRKDLPKETAYRQIEWTRNQFHGPYETVEVTGIREVPHERYQRTHVEAPSVELSAATSAEGNKIVVSPEWAYVEENHNAILHTINLFLELFGECYVLDAELSEPVRGEVRRLNWKILPPGGTPWCQLRARIESVIARLPNRHRAVIEQRFQRINSHEPEFMAVGQAGFRGYLIFGFPDRDLYVLECTQVNNATYVFRENWEYLSSLTKAEILDQNLHQHRVIHRRNWFDQMDTILNAD